MPHFHHHAKKWALPVPSALVTGRFGSHSRGCGSSYQVTKATRLQNIWKSKLSKSLKVRLFIAACESVLLYGSETWTLHDKGSREKFGWDIYQDATHGAGCHMEGQGQQCCPVRQVTKAEGFQTISELAQT